jgi:uncharacterized Tic20 family protein
MRRLFPAYRAEDIPSGPTNQNEQTLALLLWVLDLVLSTIGPLVLWLLKRKESRFVDFHGKVWLNHTISVLTLFLVVLVIFGGLSVPALYSYEWLGADTSIALAIGFWVVVGLALVGLSVFWLVVHIVAAVKAAHGVWYVPPLCWRFVK